MRSRRTGSSGSDEPTRRPKQPNRKLRIEHRSGLTRSLSLEALEERTMLTGHPLILPTAHTSAYVAAQTAVVTSPTEPIRWTPSTTNLADPVNGPMAKGGAALVNLYQQYLATQQPGATTSLATVMSKHNDFLFSGNSIALELLDSGSESLGNFVSDLEALGAQTTDVSQTYDSVDALVPIASLGSIAEMTAVRTMNPSLKPTVRAAYNPGAGGPAMNVAGVKAQGINGTGVQVGVLSDSVNNLGGLSTAEADGFLASSGPTKVNVIQDGNLITDPENEDEGAAMLEEIHAIAPGAALSFDTVGDTQVQFAQNVTTLANNGAKVIADDIGFIDEPYFEPGVLDDSIAAAVASGDSYFSAAGNAGNDGFREASNWVLENNQYVFNWNAGSGTVANQMQFTASVDGGTLLGLEWDNAWNGAPGSGKVVDNVQLTVTEVTPFPQILINTAFGNNNTFATGEPFQSVFLPDDGTYIIEATIQNAVGSGANDGLLTAGAGCQRLWNSSRKTSARRSRSSRYSPARRRRAPRSHRLATRRGRRPSGSGPSTQKRRR